MAGCLAAWLVLTSIGPQVAAAPPLMPTCPRGSTPIVSVDLAMLGLPTDIPPGTTVVLSRVILSPGETAQPEYGGYTAYVVEAGILKFRMETRVGGFHLEHPPLCVSPSGEFPTGGVTSVDDDGWMHIDAGTVLIAADVPIEWIGNAGNVPLEMLQLTLRFSEIDPATGQPIGDELVTDRSNRERRSERQERRDATPVP